MRGNRACPPQPVTWRGPIPAYAGEPACQSLHCHTRGAYPRVCGGTSGAPESCTTERGLSPRMRGNLTVIWYSRSSSGPIPAYAGEPQITQRQAGALGAYPRVCGGTRSWTVLRRWNRGLSPRMRGNHIAVVGRAGNSGPIPAYAGEPARKRSRAFTTRAYPRVCGGTPDSSAPGRRPWGLSPRMRGNPCVAHRRAASRGPIPAYAGEPSTSPCPRRATRAYPRVCGGTKRERRWCPRRLGLSPRMRGNPAIVVAEEPTMGPIPAYAGEP